MAEQSKLYFEQTVLYLSEHSTFFAPKQRSSLDWTTVVEGLKTRVTAPLKPQFTDERVVPPNYFFNNFLKKETFW